MYHICQITIHIGQLSKLSHDVIDLNRDTSQVDESLNNSVARFRKIKNLESTIYVIFRTNFDDEGI